MIIGVDFDGVLTDISHFFDKEGEIFATQNNIKINKKAEGYSTLEIFGWTKEDDDKYWETNLLKYTKYVEPQKDVSQVLKEIRKLGHKIYIISSRHDCDKDDEIGTEKRKISTDWLKKHDITFDKIIFTGFGKSKVPTILESGVNLFIDDSVHNLSDVAKHIPVICFDATNNRGYQDKNVTRLHSWKEILEHIKNMK